MLVRAESHAIGVARRTINARRRAEEPLDDVTLAQKVESQLLRRAHVPKGQVSVNAEEGVVFLRGREPGPSARHAGADQPIEARKATGSGVRSPSETRSVALPLTLISIASRSEAEHLRMAARADFAARLTAAQQTDLRMD